MLLTIASDAQFEIPLGDISKCVCVRTYLSMSVLMCLSEWVRQSNRVVVHTSTDDMC